MSVDVAVEIIRRGQLVAFPTETVYGLGADASNPAAVRRLFEVKGRPSSHPVIVHLASPDALGSWARGVSPIAWRLARRFWPGPLTLILLRGHQVLAEVTGGQDTVGVRVPDHPVARELLTAFGAGIAAPSANRFGKVSATRAEHVQAELGADVDYVLDGGPCRVGLESTVVDASTEEIQILRPGAITPQQLSSAAGQVVRVCEPGGHRVAAPGQHLMHYAPRAKVVVVNNADAATAAARWASTGARTALLAPRPIVASKDVDVVLIPNELDVFARRLYEIFRQVDEGGYQVAVVVAPPARDLGVAILDRLHRAGGGWAPCDVTRAAS